MSSPTFRVDLNAVSKKCAEYYSFLRESKSWRPFDGVVCIFKPHTHTLLTRIWQVWLYTSVSQTKMQDMNPKFLFFIIVIYYIFHVFDLNLSYTTRHYTIG